MVDRPVQQVFGLVTVFGFGLSESFLDWFGSLFLDAAIGGMVSVGILCYRIA